ncbi:MAG: putative zinc-binding metallopeptidase [Muribaculaceae bacterium]|nr:putative zinc-binding metallopeptidase [Muribaculaceae bacterium]
MNFRKYIMLSVTAGFLAMASACSEDKLGPTIFPDVSDDADPTSYTYKFDTWVNREYRDVYNLDFKYKMEDVEADMNYNLVPASYNNARDLCLLTKYLWFDAYKELAGVDFLKEYGPRILHLIGSAAINPSSGTEILGLAEGGLKVTLFKVNEMDLLNFNQLNEYYFRTMHHEFGHILHQTKSYPTDFNLLSTGRYDDGSWQNKAIGYVASLGFITPYASSQAREDFAETIANYVTRTDEAMELIKWMAAQGWSTGAEASDDPAADADKPYFCRYYYPDANDPDNKVYFLSSVEKDPDYRPAVVGLRNEYLHSVAEVEAYLDKLAETYDIREVEDEDTVDGLDLINQKQQIVRNWFKEQWKIDFDKLREIVQTRQQNFDIEALRAEIDAIPDPVVAE